MNITLKSLLGLLLIIVVMIVFNFGTFVYAANNAPTSTNTPSTSSGTTTSTAKLTNPLSFDTPGKLIGNIVKYLMGLVGVIAVLMIVWGGVMYMTSAGNDERVGTAKKIITGAIIGLVISILAYVIVDQVIKAIGG